MRSHVILLIAVAIAASLVLFPIDVPGMPDLLLDAVLLILMGGALFLSGWIRMSTFR